jgi:NADPH:quinone reductase-like Zn-dependent oxidoreductase
MQALRFNQTGDLNYLELVEFPMPQIQENEVLIEVRAARLNRNDLSNVMGRLPYTTIPRTPGRDYAGIVKDGPSELLGQEVWGTGKENGFIQDGSHAAYIKIHRDAVSIKPKSLSFTQAANCGTPYITAWHAIEGCQVQESMKIVVIGASGAVGNAAIELALRRKAQVLALVRNESQLKELRLRGVQADLCKAESSLESLKKTIYHYFAGGPDVIFDTTGHWLPAAIDAIGRFGKVAVIVAPGDGQVAISVRNLYRNGASIVGVNSLLYSAHECAVTLNQLAFDFDAGLMRPPHQIVEHALADAKKIYQALQGGLPGMHVFVPQHI